MKRSEALEIIKEELKAYEYLMKHNLNNLEESANYFLNAIEKNIGMLPPTINGVVETEEQEDGSITIHLWKWEDE